MTDRREPMPRDREDLKREFYSYLIGAVLSVALTLASFAIVAYHLVPPGWVIGTLALLALVQIVVHFRFFMHIDLKKSHRDDLQLILFTGLIVVLMVGGTLWILASQHARM
jgi:cytochrome o ubiquinol oxidase operon protein cyoD